MYGVSKYLSLEKSHDITLKVLSEAQKSEFLCDILRQEYLYESDVLKTEVLNQKFRNPVGVAAGFDKNGVAIPALQSLGFGYIEVGTVTPEPQDGNDLPRMFKLQEDRAIINRLGFNNDGMKKVYKRLSSYERNVPIGINIGKMNRSDYTEGLADYREITEFLGDFPSYYVLNVSCPNTPDKYEEDKPQKIKQIIDVVSNSLNSTPILVKISPDEDKKRLNSISRVVGETNIDGIIATNTTEERSSKLVSEDKSEKGGLSGRPLFNKSNETIRLLYSSTDVPIIGVGGVSDGQTAYEKIISGASLVQLYTGIVYNGLKSAYKINTELESILISNGFNGVSEAVGHDVQ